MPRGKGIGQEMTKKAAVSQAWASLRSALAAAGPASDVPAGVGAAAGLGAVPGATAAAASAVAGLGRDLCGG